MKASKLLQVIQKYEYYPRYSKWIFLFLLLIFSWSYNYHNILFKPPQSIHQWRQCDCLSITMNYYQDDNPFFEPAMHYLGRDNTGKTASDFPLIYYSVAKLWKVFGYKEFIYRLIVLLLFFSGLFALFKILEYRIKDSFIAITCALLLFTSPTLVFYANNFLMDVPALSLAIIGLYFFLRFEETSENKHFYFFAFFFILAGLLKISALLSFIAIVGLYCLELFNLKPGPEKKVFQKPFRQFLVLLSVVIIPLIWYLYAHYYNSKYNSGIFLIGILPIWELNKAEIKIVLEAIMEHIKWDYFRKETQIVFLLMFAFTLTFYKKINKTILVLLALCSIGFLSFIILFFQALEAHDYYTTNLFIIIPIISLGFFLLLKQEFNKTYKSLVFRIIILVFLIFNANFARQRISALYSEDGWQNRNYIEHTNSFVDISPYLQSIGITKDDLVLSLSDNSINISLYLMNQKGWTNFGINADSTKIKEKINDGARYLFIYDQVAYEDENLKPFIGNKIGEFRNIAIFEL